MMKNYVIELEREVTLHETASITIEAKSKTEARKTARALLNDPGRSDAVDWETSDTDFGDITIASVEEGA